MGALQFVDVPGYAAILFRRTYADLSLPGALMDRAKEWLAGTAARWSDKEKTWHFPSGATLTFGYLEHEDDKYRYQSSEFQFLGFDELTQFSEAQFFGAWIWMFCPSISKEIALPAWATAVEARKSAVAATESLVMAASQMQR